VPRARASGVVFARMGVVIVLPLGFVREFLGDSLELYDT
jgi:hypothetical protein